MTVKLLGVPYDAHSSFLHGPALAPAAIRGALTCGSANWCTESGLDLDPSTNETWSDLGDLSVPADAAGAVEAIRSGASAAMADGSALLSLGGDHMVTWPLVQAVTDRVEGLTIVHFDAHPDLYDSLDGDRFSHACPFARIMEDGKVARLVQLGIRTMNPHQREQAERFGVDVHEFRDWDGTVPTVTGPVYITIDMDALDPAFAPGVSHHEPGGLSTRQLLESLRQIGASEAVVVGADIVELNPTRDVNDVTAMVAAKLVRELLGLLIESAS
jgi:agmatinase